MFKSQIKEISEKVDYFDTLIEEAEEEVRGYKKERNLVRSALRRIETLQEKMSETEEENVEEVDAEQTF